MGESLVESNISLESLNPTEDVPTGDLDKYIQEIKSGKRFPLIVESYVDENPKTTTFNKRVYDIVDGNHRYKAYKALGIKEVPIVINKSAAAPALETLMGGTDQALLQEAAKYKSPEEFVKAKGKTFYHGSTNTGITDLKPGGTIGSRGEPQVPGVYLTDDYGTAAYYSTVNGVQVSNPKEVYLEGKIKDFNNLEDLKRYLRVKDWSEETRQLVPQLLERKGFSGFRIKGSGDIGEINVTNPLAIKTKSQLTDIWNKAKGLLK